MSTVLFATAKNSIWRKLISGKVTFKKDGDEFVREMNHMISTLGDHVFYSAKCYKKKYWARRIAFLKELKNAHNPNTIVLFCHGSKNRIFGIGYGLVNIDMLAQHIADNVNGSVSIILYACSCGKGKGDRYHIGEVPVKAGVAMRLGDELARLGVDFKIVAHISKGHATENPNCVYITKNGVSIHKQIVVERVTWWGGKKDPTGRKRWLTWVKMLKTNENFRFRFPFMSQIQIHQLLDDMND